MYSADDINELLKQYISSPAGKKHLKEKGVEVFTHNKKSAMRIAQMLKDDINNFHSGFVFSGLETGKKTHVYFHPDEIYIDDNGNEINAEIINRTSKIK